MLPSKPKGIGTLSLLPALRGQQACASVSLSAGPGFLSLTVCPLDLGSLLRKLCLQCLCLLLFRLMLSVDVVPFTSITAGNRVGAFRFVSRLH